MANEITISAVTGLTPVVQLYSGSTPIGGLISFTEIQYGGSGTGVYVGSVPPGTPYGQYAAIAIAGSEVLASGQLWWDGDFELPVGLTMLQGLDPNNPMTVTTNSRTTGPIGLSITGNGISNTEVQRTS